VSMVSGSIRFEPEGSRPLRSGAVATGEVRLEVPAAPEFLRISRIMAAGVASRVGFTLDEVEDLRIAIDELCFALVGARGRTGTITLRYLLEPDQLAVEGIGRFSDGLGNEPVLSAMSNQILAAVVDECELSAGVEGPQFRLVKRHRSE
jgi:serine/threonine-protein kinase RsbW